MKCVILKFLSFPKAVNKAFPAMIKGKCVNSVFFQGSELWLGQSWASLAFQVSETYQRLLFYGLIWSLCKDHFACGWSPLDLVRSLGSWTFLLQPSAMPSTTISAITVTCLERLNECFIKEIYCIYCGFSEVIIQPLCVSRVSPWVQS